MPCVLHSSCLQSCFAADYFVNSERLSMQSARFCALRRFGKSNYATTVFRRRLVSSYEKKVVRFRLDLDDGPHARDVRAASAAVHDLEGVGEGGDLHGALRRAYVRRGNAS